MQLDDIYVCDLWTDDDELSLKHKRKRQLRAGAPSGGVAKEKTCVSCGSKFTVSGKGMSKRNCSDPVCEEKREKLRTSTYWARTKAKAAL